MKFIEIDCFCLYFDRITIDTPTNREAMPDSDFTKWTHPDAFSDAIFEWSTSMKDDIINGGLYEFETYDGETEVNEVEIVVEK